MEPVTKVICRILENGSTAVLITLVSGELNQGAKLLVEQTGALTGSLGDSTLDRLAANHALKFINAREETRLFKVSDFAPDLIDLQSTVVLFEQIKAEPRLVIAGAGHVGAALARLAALTGYRVTLIDDRPEFLARDLFASAGESSIELTVANNWAESINAASGNGRGVSVAIVTRGHKQDEDCLRAAISCNADYIGMIGSKRRTNIVLDKLRDEGADSENLRRVRAPIGLDIGAISPEEVALSILAEIIAERRGGPGQPLSAWRRK